MNKWIEIDRKIIASNIRIIKSRLKKIRLMVVVKANAYGHGIEEVSKIAEKSRADFLGVMNIEEGEKIRKFGVKLPVMILSPVLFDEIEPLLKTDFIPTVDNIEFLRILNKKAKRIIPVNLDIDLGLKRWGVDLKDAFEFSKKIKQFENIKLFSISTHIAYTPYKNMIDAKEKLEKFSKVCKKIKEDFNDVIIHAANSLIFLDFPDYYFDMVRIGNLVYGIYPYDIYSKRKKNPIDLGIKRPWKFFAKIVSIKNVKKGETFGYASEIVATKNIRIATIPVGYSDGLSMIPSDNVYKIGEGERMWGEINSKKAYFISRPSISHTLLDVSDIKEAKIGTIVSLSVRRTAANSMIRRIYK